VKTHSFQFVLLLIATFLVGCDAVENALGPTERKATGKWIAAEGGGGGGEISPKNHWYTFQVDKENQPVKIKLESSDIDVTLYVYDPLGQNIGYNIGTRSYEFDRTLGKGEYRIVVATRERRAVGGYNLTFTGIDGEPVRVPFERLSVNDGNWGPDGGSNYISFRNHFYTFEVTEDNAVIDCELLSPEVDAWLLIRDPLGQEIAETFNGRDLYRVKGPVNKGIYNIMAGTSQRDALGTYKLNIFGKVRNLQKIPSQSKKETGEWTSTNRIITYSLNVTHDNSLLDVTLKSSGTNVYAELLDANGARVRDTGGGRSNFLVHAVNKGVYRVRVQPWNTNGVGPYELTTYGQFTDFKKL
jgi:hypothetical protein